MADKKTQICKNADGKAVKLSKLLACPFCGYRHPRLHEGRDWIGRYTVYCPNCGARIGDEDEWGTDEYEAVEAWNTRAG